MGNRATQIGAHVLLFFLVFGMSATVDIAQMRKQLKNRTAILIGIFLQFVILPFVGFLIVKILKMDAAIGVTLLVVTSSPGGSYSNCEYIICFYFLRYVTLRYVTANNTCGLESHSSLRGNGYVFLRQSYSYAFISWYWSIIPSLIYSSIFFFYYCMYVCMFMFPTK